ncbi:MAG: ABC transporter permease [Rhodanobacteraceae bacterium]|jgi:putative ABC transport system permease protein|nr:ABC transporter permease [Rhodanobacteraceae bacterium]
MRGIREVRGALTQALLTTLTRPRHLLLSVAGLLIAGATLLGLLTIPAGLDGLAARTGLDDVAVVLAGNQPSEAAAGMSDAEKATLIGNLPGVARSTGGSALIAPQFVVNIKLRRRDGATADVMLRGVSPAVWQVLGEHVRLVRGAAFGAGLQELIAGAGVARDFVALDTGAQTLVRKRPWRVSGEFTADGGLWESELWTDIGILQATWNAPGRISAWWVKLTSPAAFDSFEAALSGNSSLKGMYALPQRDYYRMQVGFIYRYTQIAAWGISLLLGLAALLAIANALHMALSARQRETALLRALGFRRTCLALSMLIEVVAISLVCACIVILVGWCVLDGRAIASATFFQSIGFPLRVSANVASWTVFYTCTLGVLAALWPISRALLAPLGRSAAEP